MVGFHPISTARKVLVWSKTTISALIEYTIVVTFTILFSIITRIKHLRPSTRDRLSAVINPQRSRRPIFPSFPASSSSSSSAREAANSKPLALPSPSPLPALTAPEPHSPLPDHQFLALTADDNFSDTAVGSVTDHDSSSYPFPSPAELSSEYKIKEAEHAAKLITARAQRLADGMLTSAAALHDTWVQDAHRQYHAIIAKARSETEPLAAQLEQLRKRVEECEDKGIQTDDIVNQTEEQQQQQKQTTLRFSTVQFVDNPPSSSTPSPSILNEKNDIELPPLPQLLAAAARPVTPVKQIITPPSPQSAATSSPSTRPLTGARPSTSYSESPNTSPTRPRKLSKRPKSMDMMGMSPLASLSPAESAANTAMKRNSSGVGSVGGGSGGSKRGAVRGFMEKTSNRLFSGSGPFGGSGEKEGGGVLVNVARSTSGKKGKKEKK